ncbi:MAG: hypothetical protein GXO87_06475 [Chlorobi bacterium]|nr:hypothetical protein [Chlorobiota bacterium]
MKSKFLLTWLVILTTVSFGQSDRDFFTMFKGDSLAFFLLKPLGSNETLTIYRKTDTGYVNLTQDEPVRAILDDNAVPVLLGDNLKIVQKALRTEDNMSILRTLRSNTFRGTVLCLFIPNAAKISGRWFVDSGLSEGQKYKYKLLFRSVFGDTLDIIERTVTAKSIIPKAPNKLTLEEGNEQIKLKWSYPQWDGTFTDLGIRYNVYRKIKGEDKFKIINKKIIIRDDNVEPSYNDLWLNEGISYTYYVTIVDPVGNESAPSKQASVLLKDKTPPQIIDYISDESDTLGIYLTWTMSTALDAKGYYVYRSLGLSKKFYKITKDLIPADKPFFVDSLVYPNKQFFYSVTVVDTAGNESEKSNAHGATYKDNIPPLPPEDVSFKIENGLVRLSWKKSKSKDVDGYFVYRGERKDITPKLTDLPLKSTTYVDSGYAGRGFVNGGNIYYKVAAFDSSRNLSEMVEFTAYLPDKDKPFPPGNFSLQNYEGRYVEVYCGMSPSLDAVKYQVFRKEENKPEAKKMGTFEKVPVYYRDTSVVKGIKYIYYAVAIDTVGNVSEPSPADTILFKDFSPPPAPRDIMAKNSNGKVELSWGVVIDFDMAGYNVYRSDFPTGTFQKINNKVITETKFVDNSGNKNYFYRIKAVDTSGNESEYDKTVAPR